MKLGQDEAGYPVHPVHPVPSVQALANTALVNTFPVTILVTSLEAWPVNFCEVSEARLLEVMRALGIIALVLLTIVPAGFETIIVRLTRSFFAVVKNVMVVPVVVTPGIVSPSVRISPASKSKRTIYAIGVWTNDYYPTPALRLRFA